MWRTKVLIKLLHSLPYCRLLQCQFEIKLELLNEILIFFLTM